MVFNHSAFFFTSYYKYSPLIRKLMNPVTPIKKNSLVRLLSSFKYIRFNFRFSSYQTQETLINL